MCVVVLTNGLPSQDLDDVRGLYEEIHRTLFRGEQTEGVQQGRGKLHRTGPSDVHVAAVPNGLL